ncbi:hypothetical protein Pelo_3489 [Pelomyxa schiedti]|nr:hypothetical protein Pelo_3489 [Pelomyxa schiedti]
MGVTREIKLHNCWPWDKFPRGPIPISPSHVVLTESITADLVQNSLLNVMTQQRQLMLSGKRFGVTSAQSSNNKWWVRCDGDGTLAIASLILIMGNTGGGNAGNDIEKVKVVEISMEFPKVPELKCASVSFSMKTPNELVLVMHDSARTRNILAVVDVERTFTSNKLAILSIITCLATARGSIATSCVCMTKSTGQRSLFVKGHYLATGRATVYEVVGEPDGEMVPISNHVGGLSQLSSSLFCIAKSGGCVAEIWDCHNTSSPLKVIEAMPQSSLLALVLAHPEVTFQKSQTSYKNNSIEVFVAASKIGTLLFPSQTSEFGCFTLSHTT